MCEGTLTITVEASGEFGGSGLCTEPSLGEFGEYTAAFSGTFNADGEAAGSVSMSSFTVDGTYSLTGEIGSDGLTLEWFVDEIRIDGRFESTP